MRITIAFKASVVQRVVHELNDEGEPVERTVHVPLSTATFALNLDDPGDRKEAENMTPKNAQAVLFAIARKRLAKGYPRNEVFPVSYNVSAAELAWLQQQAYLRAQVA